MNAGNKQLSKKEQKAIVNKTHTGQLGLSVGNSMGVNSKPKSIRVKTIRKRG